MQNICVWIWKYECVEVTFNNRSAVTYHKINLAEIVLSILIWWLIPWRVLMVFLLLWMGNEFLRPGMLMVLSDTSESRRLVCIGVGQCNGQVYFYHREFNYKWTSNDQQTTSNRKRLRQPAFNQLNHRRPNGLMALMTNFTRMSNV